MRPTHQSFDDRERVLTDWLAERALPAYDAYRSDPSKGIPLEKLWAMIGKRKG